MPGPYLDPVSPPALSYQVAVQLDISAHEMITASPLPAWRLDPEVLADGVRQIRLITSAGDILRSRQLLARTYLREGYIDAAGIGPDGVQTPQSDPWSALASYFAALGAQDEMIATVRLLHAPRVDLLPTMRLPGLDPVVAAELASYRGDQVVELSGVCRARGTSSDIVPLLYSYLWGASIQAGHVAWLMHVDRRVLSLLRIIAGDAVEVFGPAVDAPVMPVLPALIWTGGMNEVLRKRVADHPEHRGFQFYASLFRHSPHQRAGASRSIILPEQRVSQPPR